MDTRPSAKAPAPTVFVVDDEAEVRDALVLLMRSVALKCVVFPSAQAFLATYSEDTLPACVLLDLRMPGMSGLDLFGELKRRGSRMPAVIMTGHGEVSVAVRAMKEGVFDFIEKPFKDQALLDLVQQALALCSHSHDKHLHQSEIETRVRMLTPREREVMDLVVQGKLNKVIAYDLGLSTRTVELHRARVMEKMRARTFSDLVRMAMALEPGTQPA
jgi:two-component system response regulator FixJ